jgi:hypothetical protein
MAQASGLRIQVRTIPKPLNNGSFARIGAVIDRNLEDFVSDVRANATKAADSMAAGPGTDIEVVTL